MKDTSLLDYYLAIRTEKERVMEAHSRHIRHYVTLILAILAVEAGAAYQFRYNEGLVFLASTLGCAVNILMCIVAVLACDRAYQMFLELVTIAIKLEAALGLDDVGSTATARTGNSTPFAQDKHLLPDRWLEAAEHDTAAEFVHDNMSGGINRIARITMAILAGMNALLWVCVTLLLLLR